MGRDPMIVTVAMLRAAGLNEAQIVRVCDLAEQQAIADREEAEVRQREATKLRVRKLRERRRVTPVTPVTGDIRYNALQGQKPEPDQAPRHVDKRDSVHILSSLPSSSLSSLSSLSSVDRPLPAAARAKRTPTPLTAQWVLPEEGCSFAAAKGWPQARIDTEEQRFRDYWLASGKAKADWAATWRNWVTSPYQTNGGQRGNGQGRRSGSVLDAFDRLGEKLRQAGASEDYVPGSSGPRPLQLDQEMRAAGLKLVPKR